MYAVWCNAYRRCIDTVDSVGPTVHLACKNPVCKFPRLVFDQPSRTWSNSMKLGQVNIPNVVVVVFSNSSNISSSNGSSCSMLYQWQQQHYPMMLIPSPVVDIISAMMIVWRIRGKIIRTVLCCVLHDSCAQRYAHTREQFLKSSMCFSV